MAPPRRRRGGSHPLRVLAALAALIVVMLVSVTGAQTLNPGKWAQRFEPGLGLDLSSGTQVALKASTLNGKPPTTGDMDTAIAILQSRVDGTGVSGASIQQQGTDQINVTVPGQSEQQVVSLLSQTAKLAFRQVLLFQPHTSAAPGTTTSPSPSPSGTATPKANPPASPSAGASAAGKNGAAGKASSTQKAKSSALIVRKGATPAASAPATPSSATAFGSPSSVSPAVMKLFDKLVCKPSSNPNTVNESWKATVGYNATLAQWDNPNSQTVSCDAQGNKYVLDKPVFQGKDVTSVQTGLQQNSTAWIVSITLNSAATKAFGALTTKQANDYLPNASTNQNDAVLAQNAVVLGGNVMEAPTTQAALTSGNFDINGGSVGFTQEQATNLANILKYGQLPLNLQTLSANYVSPTLGHNSLVAGLIAGIIGLIVVLIYLLFYYRGLGLFVAVPSLLIAALLSWLGVALLSRYDSYTMELAGIAGLIVAIGITADSFIVYFERLRDEVRDGKQLRPAVESGWRRARRTILVSDTVQFLAAVLLYKFATADVQGFAFTLGLTTLIDVVVVFTFTKPTVTLLANTKFFGGGHRWSGLDPKRLGARAPWRSGVRRTQRVTHGPRAARNATTTREA